MIRLDGRAAHQAIRRAADHPRRLRHRHVLLRYAVHGPAGPADPVPYGIVGHALAHAGIPPYRLSQPDPTTVMHLLLDRLSDLVTVDPLALQLLVRAQMVQDCGGRPPQILFEVDEIALQHHLIGHEESPYDH